MLGFNGRFLRVNLETGQCRVEEPPEDFYKRYLGGRGFIVATLLREIPAGIDALDPRNKLVFATGPITGHSLFGHGRHSVGAKSPLSGGFGEAEAGGSWGVELKRAGLDAVIVEGRSPKPVYLWIQNGSAEIRDGVALAGLEVGETIRAICRELGEERIRVSAIGPAGERLVRYACIVNDFSHCAGRMGMGAVMGSKNLKAIAVRGRKLPEVASREKIVALNRWMAQNHRKKTQFWKWGTGSGMVNYEAVGNLPVRNFSGERFPQAERITPQRLFEKSYVESMEGCAGCAIRCKRKVRMGSPWNVDPVYGGPEYETLAAFGSNCGIDNLEAIAKANEICNRYGIDTLSAGGSISFAMECVERGILSPQEVSGLDLRFGNAEAMLIMVERVAKREGFGEILGEGVRRASERIGRGSDQFAIHVKGEELPMHEPRYQAGMGLHYSVHATGADHNTGIHDDRIVANLKEWDIIDVAEWISKNEMSPRKARMLYQMGIWRHMGNVLGLCIFVPWSSQQVVEAMAAVTGWPMSHWKLMKAVERGITLARIFNLREGFSIHDDRLPSRFSEDLADGRGGGIKEHELGEAQRAYYQMLGWDEEGVPTAGRLAELGIEWVAEVLGKARG
jgi:aldehyde:ferredoxin oxidoreductase